MHRRTYLALPALALAGALTLTACGSDTASTGTSSSGHSAGHGSGRAEGNDADVVFAAQMVPHHAQAVEMSEIILSKNPPAEVAALARQIKNAQAPEIEQLNRILRDLGEPSDPSAHREHGGGHGGMMTDEDLAALRAATGSEATTLYLTAMIAHHQGAIEAADTQIGNGRHSAAIELAKKIRQDQAAEIATMEKLLSTL